MYNFLTNFLLIVRGEHCAFIDWIKLHRDLAEYRIIEPITLFAQFISDLQLKHVTHSISSIYLEEHI